MQYVNNTIVIYQLRYIFIINIYLNLSIILQQFMLEGNAD